MKKSLIKFLGILFIIGIISIIIGRIAYTANIIKLPNDMLDFQFNVITITTVFAGFSFSVLGVLISISATSAMEKLKETSALPHSCSLITKSIVVFMISFIFSFIFILGIDQFFLTNFKISNIWFFFLEIGYLVYGIILFLQSVYRMSYMMHYVFADNQKNAQAKINRFQKSIENIRKMNDSCNDKG